MVRDYYMSTKASIDIIMQKITRHGYAGVLLWDNPGQNTPGIIYFTRSFLKLSIQSF